MERISTRATCSLPTVLLRHCLRQLTLNFISSSLIVFKILFTYPYHPLPLLFSLLRPWCFILIIFDHVASIIDVGIQVTGNVSIASGVIVNVVQPLIIEGSITLNSNSTLSTNATLNVFGTLSFSAHSVFLGFHSNPLLTFRCCSMLSFNTSSRFMLTK